MGNITIILLVAITIILGGIFWFFVKIEKSTSSMVKTMQDTQQIVLQYVMFVLNEKNIRNAQQNPPQIVPPPPVVQPIPPMPDRPYIPTPPTKQVGVTTEIMERLKNYEKS